MVRSPLHKMDRGDEPHAPLFFSLGRPIPQPLVNYRPIKWDALFGKSDNRPQSMCPSLLAYNTLNLQYSI